jgi:hypothetical protein
MKRVIPALFLFLILAIQGLPAKSFDTLKSALKQTLAQNSGSELNKKTVKITKNQAAFMQKEFGSLIEDGEKFKIFMGKDTEENVLWYAIEMVDILERYGSYHRWVHVFNPDLTVKQVFLVELTDEYSYALDNDSFLQQFSGRSVSDLNISSNIDAVTGATMSSDLLVNSIKMAHYIIDQMINK